MAAEIRIKFSGDDAGALAVIDKMRAGLERAKQTAKEFSHGVVDAMKGFTSTMAHAAGFEGIGGGLRGFVESAVEASRAAEGQTRSIAQTLAMTDQSGASFTELKTKARGMREEFMEMGMRSGVMAKDVIEAFNDIATRSGKSTEEVVKLTDQILQAGRVTGDTETLTRGMRMLESGMTGARNPIIALIRSTGVLHGSIHEVSQQMAKLKPEDQIRAGEEAISRLASKAKGMEPTFGMLANNMRQMKENILEDIGGPLIKGIMPTLMEFQKYLVAHRADIERYAKTIGEKVGAWVKEAAKVMQEAFKWLQTHASEIKDALSFGAGLLKGAIEFMLGHKEAIIAMLTVKGLSGAGMGGPTAALGGGIAAIYSMLGDKAGELKKQGQGYLEGDVAATQEALRNAAKSGDMAQVAHFTKILNEELAELRGTQQSTAYQVSQLNPLFKIMTSGVREFGGEAEAWIKRMHGMTESVKATKKTIDQAFETAQDVSADLAKPEKDREYTQQQQTIDGAMDNILNAYNKASAVHNDAVMQYAAATFAKSKELRDSLIWSGQEVAGGFDALIANVRQSSAAAAEDMANTLAKREATKRDLSKPTFQQNFSGGQTFHISQDFRQADPDNVALVMRKDLFRHALARGMAKTGRVFGP